MAIECVVPISGGKDSQACLKLATIMYGPENILGLFCDTQFEHPTTYAHIEHLKDLYGIQILTITKGNVLDKCLKHKRFPSGTARFCTDELKIRPSRDFYSMLARIQKQGFQVWYGMRSDESHERRVRYQDKIDTMLYPAHEVLPKKYPKFLQRLGVMFCMPILSWSEKEVFHFLDGEQNPLYPHHSRVGCYPCLAAGDGAKETAFSYDDFGKSQRIKVLEIGKTLGKNIFTSKGGIKRNAEPECMICRI